MILAVRLLDARDGRLVVVNIDAPSAGMVNSGADAVHTLSIIKVKGDN